jgi:hypothetical protein
MHRTLKKILLWIASRLGGEVVDVRTGKSLGKALCLSGPWGIRMIGLPHAVRMVFLPEDTTRYTNHRLGFSTHPEPDYPSLHRVDQIMTRESAGPILWVILVHQNPESVNVLHGYWNSLGYSPEGILFVHAGKRSDYENLQVPNKVFVEDEGIRTVRHPLQKQSYAGVFREVSSWMEGRDFGSVALVEYDHLPLIADWGDKLRAHMDGERADVLCHHLTRVDGTNASHYLYHLHDPRFSTLFNHFSVREDRQVVFNAILTGSFWRRIAFDAVAARPDPFPVYLELYLPSVAHHLGFRVRGFGDQDRYVQVVPMEEPFSEKWTVQGAWSIHQVKSLAGFQGKDQ